MRYSRYDKGDWNTICDACGKKFKASELRKRWDNLMVCSKDFEYRQPQDFVRGKADLQVPPYSRPDTGNIFQPMSVAWQTGDDFTFRESVARDSVLVVPDILEGRDSGSQSLGEQYLGEFTLAGDFVSKGYNSRISFLESVSIGLGFNTTNTDSIGFSEVFYKGDGEVSSTDSMTFSEVVAVSTFTNKALGETALASITLG